ncbi:CPBP family intramembrane glutamic endopeptidase [Actinoalloteichus sp. GBA129-24]|uniref:CPBP family intramembrane glutamic endopeptidase n=1 Tax=Actinoalloteichus sp. GBA129-24 TaxID=1612551 RepID=UPI0009506E64|nr:CPBP family intramembrane glutamic endopeptidase [Actinoalloteichus sp. GBA129-24]APU19081.1 CAAX protease self-immunity [Actinoalloteichus sp. GBA129-24]
MDAEAAERTDHEIGRFHRVLRSPLGWMLVGTVGIGGVSALSSSGHPVLAVVGAVAAVAVYWVVMRYVARRSVPEIAPRRAVSHAAIGIALGVVLIAASVLMVITEFSFTRSSGGITAIVASMVVVQLWAAVTEELIFRGLVLQALERLCGSGMALAITAVLFGLLHLANPGATVWSSFAIAVEAGVLLGAAFLWRRNLWLVIGLHFAWNTSVALLGIPVSGHEAVGVLTAQPTGPDLLTGGIFGIEASIAPIVVSLLLATPMLIAARRRGNLAPWRHR